MKIDGTAGSYPLDAPCEAIAQARMYRKTATVLAAELLEPVRITTPEGEMVASAGDYLAQHADGHARPIRRAVFLDTYVPS